MNTNTMCPSLSKSYYCLLNNKGKKQTIETSKSGMTIAVMLKISLIRTNTVHRLVVCLAWSRLTLVINITFYQTAENVFLKKKKNKGNNSANWANSLDIHCMSHSLFTLYLFLIKKVALMWRIFIITNVVFIVTFIFISTHSIKGIF